jgi:hypothetical protein
MKIALLLLMFTATLHAEVYRLDSTPKTVHYGYFDASVRPVIRMKSGDTVENPGPVYLQIPKI